jgi:hypothetical protein
MLPLPEVADAVAAARPIGIPGKPIGIAGRDLLPPGSGEWITVTPEGYFDGSANSARFALWNVGGRLVPAERYLRRFRRPDLVRKALRGEKITAPPISRLDVPPTIRFVSPAPGASVTGDFVTVTVEATDTRPVKEIELLVNGRPLAPNEARPIGIAGRPIGIAGRPIEIAGRPIGIAGRPIGIAGRALGARRIATRATFRFTAPAAKEIVVRAVAYSRRDIGSDPVELVLNHAKSQSVVADLYVLSVGVSHCKNADGKGFKNLEFPAKDAQAIAARFSREGLPLYRHVEVRTLLDEQATAANLRAELKRLQAKVRPRQVDTVVVFLSGHGVSVDGRYTFATYDFDARHAAGSGLSGRELRQALGGRLRAGAVFLFVDTCHAGGLRGRSEDLGAQIGEGVNMFASSVAKEFAYESRAWGHGAFTLALLHALNNPALARDGKIRWNALAYAIPDEVEALMKAAGRPETDQEPYIPLAGRHLTIPIAQIRQ